MDYFWWISCNIFILYNFIFLNDLIVKNNEKLKTIYFYGKTFPSRFNASFVYKVKNSKSKFSTDIDNPIKTCALSSAFFKSNLVFLITTSSLNIKNCSKKSFRLQVFGLLLTIASVLNPKELSIDVYLNNCLFIVQSFCTITVINY